MIDYAQKHLKAAPVFHLRFTLGIGGQPPMTPAYCLLFTVHCLLFTAYCPPYPRRSPAIISPSSSMVTDAASTMPMISPP